MTEQIWHNIIKAFRKIDRSFDELDEMELMIEYERVSGEKIPNEWQTPL